MSWLDGITNSTDMGLSKLWEMLKDREAGVGSLSLLQQIFPTQRSNQGFLHCRQIFYQLSYEGSPYNI